MRSTKQHFSVSLPPSHTSRRARLPEADDGPRSPSVRSRMCYGFLCALAPWGVQLRDRNGIHQAHSAPTHTPPTRDLPEATFCLGGYTCRKINDSPGDQLSFLTVAGFTLVTGRSLDQQAFPRSLQGLPSIDGALLFGPSCSPYPFSCKMTNHGIAHL